MTDPRVLPVPARARRRSPALWVLLVLGLVGDLLASAGVLPTAVGVVCGVIALGCLVALVRARVRRR